MLKNFLILISGLLFSLGIQAQNKLCPPSSDKKALHEFNDALNARKKPNNYKEVKALLQNTINLDSSFADAWKLLADEAWENKDFNTALIGYKNALSICPDIASSAYYRLGNLYFNAKKYNDAIISLTSFLDFGKAKEEEEINASQLIERSKLLMNPVPFNPKPLEGVSTTDPEYLACISPDGDYCFFTRRFEMQNKGALTPISVEKFMVSEKTDGHFTKGTPMPPPFNKKQTNNEGSPSISIDNKYLFFTQNNDGNFDIYVSEAEGSGWSDPHPVFKNKADNDYWESQPCISPDGRKLYFASYRDSITKTSDIYVSEKVNNEWSKPHILPGPVNSAGNEKSPFLHPDNKTLYFSSNGLGGMGGYDIFISKLDSNGNWTTPVNLGYPINTEADEVGFFVSTDGQNGYYASNNISSNGGYDIFQFPLYPNIKPERVLFIRGEITAEDSGDPVSATLELKNAVTKETMPVNYDTITGKYASVVLFNQDYILTVKKKGFAFNSSYFSKEDSMYNEPQKVDLKLISNQQGKAYTLHNILFETNSAEMNQRNRTIVEQFAEYLKLNTSLKVGIYGHTDNQGSPEDNLLLSEKRAKAVYDYLISLGISNARLSYKGFGETKPLFSNDTADHKAMNRRTEFYIISL
jgi:outer membrane protein OmpA-like peptidoglycan-associated protein/Tol biopolymer transport system component